MLTGFLILLCAQMAGEGLRAVCGLPIPGPVLGLFLLAGVLAWRGRAGGEPSATLGPPRRTAEVLIRHFGLLFVPAGAGVVARADLLSASWAPLAGALLVSTAASLLVTGAIMHRVLRGTHADGRVAREEIDHEAA